MLEPGAHALGRCFPRLGVWAHVSRPRQDGEQHRCDDDRVSCHLRAERQVHAHGGSRVSGRRPLRVESRRSASGMERRLQTGGGRSHRCTKRLLSPEADLRGCRRPDLMWVAHWASVPDPKGIGHTTRSPERPLFGVPDSATGSWWVVACTSGAPQVRKLHSRNEREPRRRASVEQPHEEGAIFFPPNK